MPRPLNSRCVLLLAVCLLPLAGVPSQAEDKARPERYMRVLFDDMGKPQAMETAIVRFKYTDPAKADCYVDLVGAVHIGDKSYYDELNKEFAGYDALLYELVAPKGMKVPKGTKGGTGSFVSELQLMMKRALALEFQLEQVDYEKENFVHADMTPDEFSKSMTKLKEDPLTMFLRLMSASAKFQAESQRPPPSDLVIVSALFDRKRGPTVLKRIFAEQLAEADVLLEALNGPQGSTIITERNKKAIEVLEDELKAGKKKIGIFYGAAHMQDMEERMCERLGLKRDSVRWLKAWDLTPPPAPEKESESNEGKKEEK